ncbi:MAG: FAD-dependent oxidoreductase [Candidatus Omnitrophota bacterium]
MDKKTDILIVGAGPAGVVCAGTAGKYYPGKKITVLKNVENGVVPCGIPYMFSSLKSCDENMAGTIALEEKGVEVFAAHAEAIDRDKKMLRTKNGDDYTYEKLVLATGSSPVVPPIPGIDKNGVYPIYKDMDTLKRTTESVKKAKKVLIIGGGFIGVEFADELSEASDVNVYLAEMLPSILANSFDAEFADLAKEKLEAKGVEVLTGVRVEELKGDKNVEEAVLSSGRTVKVDAVVLGIGASPNTALADNTGLDLRKGKGIWVDEYMRTSDPDIFAVGDCAGKRDFYTRKDTLVMLASTATAEARIAGANLYQLKVVRENKGTIAIYSTYVDGLVLGSAGLTEVSARKEGFEIVTGCAEMMDKHPAAMPGAKKIKVKLIFSKHSGIIMGGQVAGGMSAGEMINTIGMAIQQRVSLSELETLQVATHPYLTSAPTMYPLVVAAQNAQVL